MKQLYTTLALASMMVGTISAAVPFGSDAQKSFEVPSKAMALSNELVEFNRQMLDKGTETRAISSIEDIVGPYKVNEDWWYPFEGTQPESPSFYISALSENLVEISVTNMAFCVPILASVDLASGTITIKADDNKNLNADPYMELHLRYINDDGTTTKVSSVTGTITSSGQIDFLRSVLLWGDDGGYYFGCGYLALTPMEMFSFNANEWVECGTAKFTDNFLNPLLVANDEKPIPTTEAAFYYNKANPSTCLLNNPYGVAQWTEAVGEVENGFIVFDISNHDCVTMSPLVGSGVIINFGSQNEPDIQELYFFNNEGYQVMSGRSTESLVEEVEEAMDPFNQTIADYLSVYDEATRTVNIRNGFFGQTTEPLAKYFWNGVSGPAYLTATIVLPEAYVSGVNDIVTEDSNAPVKYYNLQGMEVANPEAGQLVIKKQGSKTSKFIVK